MAMPPAFTASYQGFVNGESASNLVGSLGFATNEPPGRYASAGSYTITPYGLSSGNYDITFVPNTLAVYQRVLTITAANKSMTYGAALPTLTATYSGFASGETAQNLTKQPTLTTTAKVGSPVKSYPIVASGATISNYSMSYVSGTLTVTKATPTVVIYSSASTAVSGQPVVLVAKVTAPPSGTPTGSVTFFDGATSLGTGKLDAAGRAILSVANWAVSTHQLSVSYAGDTNVLAKRSTVLLQKVQTAALEPDPTAPGQQALFIGGTVLNDAISIAQDVPTKRLIVQYSNPASKVTMAFSSAVSRVVVYGGAGNDSIQVDNGVSVPTWLFGGDGNDNLIGGGGPVLLLGGNGNDTLTSRNGRAIMIGGSGSDTVKSGSGDAILIAGTTNYDANDQALASYLLDWNSATDYATRVSKLSPWLNSSTVHDDAVADTLQGGAGQNWFFADLKVTKQSDKTAGVRKGQVVTLLS